MMAAQVVALVEDIKHQFQHVSDALAHVAAQLKQSVASVRMANYRSRKKRAVRHGAFKLSLGQEAVIVAVAQAFSVNNAALSVQQGPDLVQRKWGVAVSRQWVARFKGGHRSELSKRA